MDVKDQFIERHVCKNVIASLLNINMVKMLGSDNLW
jgi:hypothetical protein